MILGSFAEVGPGLEVEFSRDVHGHPGPGVVILLDEDTIRHELEPLMK